MGTPHRTETTDVYYFDQLSDEAKEKARQWYREGDLVWTEENKQSLEAFEARFSIKVTDWEYDAWSYRTTTRQGNQPDEVWDLSGRTRLSAYLWNNFWRVFVEPKKYGSRASRIVKEPTSCVFTGYCMDDALLAPILAFLATPRDGYSFGDLMTDCVDAWGKSCRDDAHWQQEDEQVDESILANEYEFNVEGERI